MIFMLFPGMVLVYVGERLRSDMPDEPLSVLFVLIGLVLISGAIEIAVSRIERKP